MITLTLLLPPRSHFEGGTLAPDLARAMGRADRQPDGEPGARAQLQRHATVLPRRWPMAAITRQLDAGDATLGQWLRVDPAYVRADINAGRMLACGNLGLSQDEADALLKPLRPLFGDTGFPISAPAPERWYLQLPRDAKLPDFAEPEQALGDDLYDHLPHGDAGRRWRSLLNEAQVILHNHPVNAGREAAGKLPANSVWFWGGGLLPDQVRLPARRIVTDAADLAGLARLARAVLTAPADSLDLRDPPVEDLLIDLRRVRDPDRLQPDWLRPALAALAAGRVATIDLDFADGGVYRLRRRQRWRFWRRSASDWRP